MHSLTASACLLFSHYSLSDLSSHLSPSVFSVVDSRIPRRRMQQFAALNIAAVKETGSLLGCSESFKKGNCYKGLYWGCSGFLRRCKDWDSDADVNLEAEILEFMKNSKNPELFPTKKELVDCGRMDLVDAIIKKGGWLAYGWDLDEEAEEESGEVHVKDRDSFPANDCGANHGSNEIRVSGHASSSTNYFQPAISSCRSV